MILNIHEVLENASHIEDKKEKIAYLRDNETTTLLVVLQCFFNNDIQFFTTEIPESYKPNDSPVGMGYEKLHTKWSKLHYFMNHRPESTRLTLKKKNQMLLQFLESLEAKEAEVIIRMFKKDHKHYGLRKTIVKEAFPNLGV